MESRGHGVLDTRVRGYDEFLWSPRRRHTPAVIIHKTVITREGG